MTTATATATATLSEFAALEGVSPSYITKLKQHGRLVLTADGKVEVEASRRRIEETKDPNRDDVRARHAARKKADVAPPPAPPLNERPPPEPNVASESFQKSRAVKEHYLARTSKFEYERMIGELVDRADVDFVLADYGATVRGLLQRLADRLSPQVYPLKTLEETHAAIVEAVDELQRELDETMKRRSAGLGA